MARRGLDFETEMAQIAKEQALMKELGIEKEQQDEQPAGQQQPNSPAGR